MPAQRFVTIGDDTVPALGQGTWGCGERASRREDEIAALRTGFELGLTLVDTAEMYAGGGAEELLGAALGSRRDEMFLVSKVLPHNASARGTVEACRRSLARLRTDRIDLYLLHWPGSIPLDETLAGFDQLASAGEIRYWGVSNFDAANMAELAECHSRSDVAANQVLYNLTRRGVEHDLLPWCAANQLPVMAYSPIEQGRLLEHPDISAVARRHDATPAQVALAWVLRRDDMCTIPKAASPAHVRDNHGALDVVLTEDDLAALDHAFPPPTEGQPLEML